MSYNGFFSIRRKWSLLLIEVLWICYEAGINLNQVASNTSMVVCVLLLLLLHETAATRNCRYSFVYAHIKQCMYTYIRFSPARRIIVTTHINHPLCLQMCVFFWMRGNKHSHVLWPFSSSFCSQEKLFRRARSSYVKFWFDGNGRCLFT